MTDIRQTVDRIARQTLALAMDPREPGVPNYAFDPRRWQQWDWSMGVGFYGLWQAYDLTRDDTYVARMKEWIDGRIDAGIPAVCVNTTALLPTVLRLHQRHPEARYDKLCRVFDDSILHTGPRARSGALVHTTIQSLYAEQLWADTLFMSVVYATQRSLLLDDPSYLREALGQLVLHMQSLYDADSGLYFHGWDDANERPLGARWGRGNAWVIASAVEILDLVRADFPEKSDLLGRLRLQVAALERLQDTEGCWRTVLDHAETYAETSVTAGVAYGVVKGIRLGLLENSYAPMAQRAVQALLKHIDGEGNVLYGSSGTGIKQSVAEYNLVPYAITPFTQGLALMALCEYARALC